MAFFSWLRRQNWAFKKVTALSGVPLRITLTAGQASPALPPGHTRGVGGWWWWSVSPLPCSAVLPLLLPLRLSSFLLPSWRLPLSALSSCDLSHVPSSRCRHSPREVVSSIWHCPHHGWASQWPHHGQASSALPVLLWPEWRNHRVSLLRVEPWAYGKLSRETALQSRCLLLTFAFPADPRLLLSHHPNDNSQSVCPTLLGVFQDATLPTQAHPNHPSLSSHQFLSNPIRSKSLLSLPTLSRVDTLGPPP